MKARSIKYFQKKEYKKWELGMMSCFYCLSCQAMNEQECICDFLEEQQEIYEEMNSKNNDFWGDDSEDDWRI